MAKQPKRDVHGREIVKQGKRARIVRAKSGYSVSDLTGQYWHGICGWEKENSPELNSEDNLAGAKKWFSHVERSPGPSYPKLPPSVKAESGAGYGLWWNGCPGAKEKRHRKGQWLSGLGVVKSAMVFPTPKDAETYRSVLYNNKSDITVQPFSWERK